MENYSQIHSGKKFKGTWMKISIIMQFLTAAAHSLSFIVKPQATSDTEKQMIDLITTYKMEMGVGFTPTFYELFTSVSAGFALLFVFAGLVNWYLWRRKIELSALKGVMLINLIVFGIMFVINLVFSFISPVVTSGLVLLSLLMTWLTWPREMT